MGHLLKGGGYDSGNEAGDDSPRVVSGRPVDSYMKDWSNRFEDVNIIIEGEDNNDCKL